VFQEVRTKVLASTGNTQTPWDSSSLTGRFYFKPPEAGQIAQTPAPAAPSADEEALKTEKTYWDSVKDSGDADSINLYLAKYPNGYFVDLAHAKLDELKGGTKVASTDSKSGNAAPQPAAADTAKASQPAAGIAFIAQSQTVYAKGGGQVRGEPNGSADLLAKLPTNTEVTATGVSTDGKWWRVAMADGKTGYMHKSVVSEKPLAAPVDKTVASAAPADQETCKADSDAAANARVAACERLLAKAGSDDKAMLAALKDLAAALNIAGRNDDAIRKYEQAAELAPREAWIYDRLGLVRLDQLKFLEARTAFEKAAELDPQNPDVVFHRGLAYTGIGDFEQARLEVKRALLTKDDPVYYEKLAEIEITLGDLDAAKTALERGRKLDSWRHSLILLAANYFTGAMDHAEGQGAVVPDDTNAALWNAVLRRARGDKEGAAQILSSTRLEIGKRDWPSPIFDALLGKLSAAKARAAAKTKPNALEFQRLCKLNFFLGEWAYLSGDKEGARAALKAAIDTRAYHLLEYAAAKARLANMGG